MPRPAPHSLLPSTARISPITNPTNIHRADYSSNTSSSTLRIHTHALSVSPGRSLMMSATMRASPIIRYRFQSIQWISLQVSPTGVFVLHHRHISTYGTMIMARSSHPRLSISILRTQVSHLMEQFSQSTLRKCIFSLIPRKYKRTVSRPS